MTRDMRIDELSASSGIKPRSIRKYISMGLVSPPSGRTRNATYSDDHLADLLTVRKFLLQGLSLAQIKEEMAPGRVHSKRPKPNSIGSIGHADIRVVHVARGVFLMLDTADEELPRATQETLISEVAVVCRKNRVRAFDGAERSPLE